MRIKRFSIVLAVAATAGTAALAAPPRAIEDPAGAAAGIVLVQSVKERPLDAVPPVDTGSAPPPAARTGPPPPPPVPPAPRLSTRTAPADDDAGPPARETPPPPTSTSRYAPPAPPAPPRTREPAYKAAPRYEEPPAASAPRRPPPARSTFAANCTQQCHLSCEASFEACNGDSSPAQPACVKKLEACRVERCACRFD